MEYSHTKLENTPDKWRLLGDNRYKCQIATPRFLFSTKARAKSGI